MSDHDEGGNGNERRTLVVSDKSISCQSVKLCMHLSSSVQEEDEVITFGQP